METVHHTGAETAQRPEGEAVSQDIGSRLTLNVGMSTILPVWGTLVSIGRVISLGTQELET